MAKIISIGGEEKEKPVEEENPGPDFFLESMKGQLSKVIIFGLDHQGQPILSCSIPLPETSFLLSVAQHLIINNCIGFDYEDE